MNILIVDDEAPARDRLAALLVELGSDYAVVGEAADGEQALALCTRDQIDLVLMDINMPGMNGLAAARELAALETPPAVVFTTAYAEHALDAFEANAVDYLLKPVRPARLLAALQRAIRPTRAQLDAISVVDDDLLEYINATYRGGVQRIAIPDVICLHAASKYVEVRHTDGAALIEESLKSLEDRFARRFLRIHRNALINPSFLTGLEKSALGRFEVILQGIDIRLEVSRRHLPSVRRLLKSD